MTEASDLLRSIRDRQIDSIAILISALVTLIALLSFAWR